MNEILYNNYHIDIKLQILEYERVGKNCLFKDERWNFLHNPEETQWRPLAGSFSWQSQVSY